MQIEDHVSAPDMKVWWTGATPGVVCNIQLPNNKEFGQQLGENREGGTRV